MHADEDMEESEAEQDNFEDVEERVHEVMTLVTPGETGVALDKRQVDIDERATVSALIDFACVCKKGLGSRPCSSQFSADHLLSVLASCSELTRSELDMAVMGQLMAG